MDIEKRLFYCNREGFTIKGLEYKSNQNNGIPIIISHGFLSNQKRMKQYAESLAKEGYVTFTFDFCGGALFGKSDGKFSEMSINSEKEDLKAIIYYIEQIDYVNAKKLILIGESQGGLVSCLVSSEYKEKINKLILLYPALCIPDDAKKGKMLMMKFNPNNIEETLRSYPFKFSAQYPKSAINIKIYDEIQKIDIPIFIIHGRDDKIVNIKYAKKAIEISRNKLSNLVILEKAGHGFNKKQAKESLKYIIEYLK